MPEPVDNRQALAVGGAAIAALIAISAIVALTGDDQSPTSSSTSTTTTEVVTTEPTIVPTTVPRSVGDRFFSEIAQRTTSAAIRARALAADNSTAADYLDHLMGAMSVAGDQPPGRLEGAEPWRVCDAGDTTITCRSFDNLTVDDNGLVTGFEIDGIPINDRLVIDGNAASSDGVTVSLASAFLTVPNDSMVLVVDIENAREDVSLLTNGFAAVYSDPILGEFEITSAVGDDLIEPNKTVRMLFVFESGGLGGDLIVPFTTDDYSESLQIALTVAAP